MTDGSALTMSMIYSLFGHGLWTDNREANLLDGGCPFYATYEAADGKYIAVGALEDRFFSLLVATLGLGSEPAFVDRWSRPNWHRMREIFALKFQEKTRDDWAAIFGSLDACVTPVLSLSEAALHPHNAARQTFRSWNGIVQPAAAPRFHRSGGLTTGAAVA
jgi:alpha-methylacyl-CoA racemase